MKRTRLLLLLALLMTAATGAWAQTSDNKASWENVMGSDKTWSNWTVADDWQD